MGGCSSDDVSIQWAATFPRSSKDTDLGKERAMHSHRRVYLVAELFSRQSAAVIYQSADRCVSLIQAVLSFVWLVDWSQVCLVEIPIGRNQVAGSRRVCRLRVTRIKLNCCYRR